MTEIIWDYCDDIDDEPDQEQFGPIIPWSGGNCPLPIYQRVKVHFRGRAPYVGPAIRRDFPKAAQENMWNHAPAGGGRIDPMYDIIGYQVAL